MPHLSRSLIHGWFDVARRSFLFASLSILLVWQAQAVQINEVAAADATTLADEDGVFSPWIELYNDGLSFEDLEGWSLQLGQQTPWLIPSVNIGFRDFLVIFASGKNRSTVGQPLHANFTLPSTFTRLALLRPDGSVASQVSLPYSTLPTSGSLGSVIVTNRLTLLTTDAVGRLLVPSSGALGTGWTSLALDDSSWTAVTNGIGYSGPPTPPIIHANSETEFSGNQGENGWFYGAYLPLPDLVFPHYQTNDFFQFIRNDPAPLFWVGGEWNFPPADPPWTRIAPLFIHPNTSGNYGEHWAMRRWLSDRTGRVQINVEHRKSDPNGDGTTVWVFHDGRLLMKRPVRGNDTTGYRAVLEASMMPNQVLDIALSPEGYATAATAEDGSDTSILKVTLTDPVSLHPGYKTDVSAAMKGINASVYYRLPFQMDSPSLTNLMLRIKHDAGFIAYLNGTEVVRRNAGSTVETAGTLLADSTADFSSTQGGNNWRYGYYNLSKDIDATYHTNDFLEFDPSVFVDGGWRLGPGDPPWTTIATNGSHPNGVNNGAEHWTIQRWKSKNSGNMQISSTLGKGGNGAGGTTLVVMHNGVPVNTLRVRGDNTVGVSNRVQVVGVQVNDVIDVALTPEGYNGDRADGFDTSLYRVQIYSEASQPATWNSSALGEKTNEEALQSSLIDLSGAIGLLQPGKNILAIHGLNREAADEDFLLTPELISVSQGREFYPFRTLSSPTPQGENELSPGDLNQFRILSVNPTSPVRVEWEAQAGTTYRVTYKESLLEPDWSLIARVTPLSSVGFFEDQEASSKRFRLYQIISE